ncbi:hypothetical protein ACFL96_12560 [Thermoproteota archaeon]
MIKKPFMKLVIISLIILLGSVSAQAMGDFQIPFISGPPQPEPIPEPAAATPEPTVKPSPQDDLLPEFMRLQEAGVTEDYRQPLNEEELFDLDESIKKDITQKNFNSALISMDRIPLNQLTRQQVDLKRKLLLLNAVEKESTESTTVFTKEEDLPPDTQKKVIRLYKEAQFAYIEDHKDVARDICIQILYMHRRNFKARKLLEYGLFMRVGSYTVENMEAKYWNNSSTHFYGGNYELAVKDLNTLALFDKENPIVFERLGSSYYMMGQKKKAVAAWSTALFLNPGNTKLKGIINETKNLIAKEDQEEQERLIQRKAAEQQKQQAPPVEKQIMGVFSNRDQAYSYANELRKQNLEPIVEEMDDGRWSVSIPKSIIENR